MTLDRALRVLLVDDSDPDVFLVEEALRGAAVDFELERFEDGADALAALRVRASAGGAPSSPLPDIVLLDIQMPRSDGTEVLHELRRIAGLEHTPVAIFTSQLPPELERELAPLARCVKKPLYLDDFLATVVQVVRELAQAAPQPPKRGRPRRRA